MRKRAAALRQDALASATVTIDRVIGAAVLTALGRLRVAALGCAAAVIEEILDRVRLGVLKTASSNDF
eukprot:SAG11_NODE_19820_length_458_cov_0.844011_1_plen_67_part_01